MTVDDRRIRIARIIGTDDTRGLRGDLARARRMRGLGHTVAADGRPIDVVIASLQDAIVRFQSRLDGLDDGAS